MLLTGDAAGEALVLAEPLSFWGGVDPVTGTVIDARHPQRGECVAGRVLVMPAGRGSSSSSSVLAETLSRSATASNMAVAVTRSRMPPEALTLIPSPYFFIRRSDSARSRAASSCSPCVSICGDGFAATA